MEENKTQKIFAERLKALRLEHGLGVRELASKIGVSHAAISFYESCKRTPDIITCKTIADFFGVTGDYLLGRSDERR